MDTTNLKNDLKTIFNNYVSELHKYREYYWKLSGINFFKKTNSIQIQLQIRGSRKIFTFSTKKIVHDKDLINELHPVDAFIIGIISNDERNGLFRDDKFSEIKKWSIPHVCSIKIKPILAIERQYCTEQLSANKVTIKNIYTCKTTEIPIDQIADNLEIVYAVSPMDALSLGYDLSEIRIRTNMPS